MNDEQKKMLAIIQGLDDTEHKRSCDIVRAPFGWHGGKAKSLGHILPHLPYRKGYCEVFGGSGVVLLARNKSYNEIFNDRHSGITCFYRCIRDIAKCRELSNRVELACHSREEFEWCKASWEDCQDEVERAARWYYMVTMSFSKLGRNFARSTGSRAATGNAYHNNLKHFWPAHERLRNVQIENQDWRVILRDFDSPDMVFYLDPPYIGSFSGAYTHNFTLDDHKIMLNQIFQTEGFVALSGYENPLYDSYKWDSKHTWQSFVSSSSMARTETNNKANLQVERGYAKECLWIKEAC